MRALLFFYQFWALILYCCGAPNSQKQWLNSLKPMIDPLFVPNDFPWLVSMSETCQGIILSRWWILSTANCLTKLKHLQSDTTGVVNQENILLGYKICLHPNFDPQVGTNPFQGDIGLVLLKYPVRSEEIPLSHTYNIFRKRCYNCQYRHCRVYQYQNHDKFATNIRKLSVKLLDLSFCHRQHIHLTKSNILCIWIQPQEDCWVQQGSPVLCFFGTHWEIVGLVNESSVACNDPVVVIKTAPYRSWMRWLMKASQKPSDPILSLSCSYFPGVKSGTQDRLSLNRIPAILTSHGLSIQPWKGRLGTFPLVRQHRNPPPVFFGSNNRKTFPGSTQLYLQNSQISTSNKFPWTSIVARLWDTLDITEPWSSSGTGSFEPLVLSGPQKISSADISIPWGFPQKDVIKYQHQTVTESVKPLVGIIGFHTLPLLNAGGSWVLFSTDIDASQLHSEIKTAQSQITRFSNLPFHSQLPAKPWLEITPNVGSWIHFMPDKTVIHMQSSEESVITQTYDATERVNSIFKPVTYSLHSGVPLIANKIEFWTHSTLNTEGLQYPTAAHTLETWFQPILNTIGAQGSIKRTNKYWILPESMSTQFSTSSALYVPFTWVPPAYNSISSWAQYKVSMIRSSNQMESITPLSKHKPFIFKPQMQTEYAPWLLINTIKPFIHSKIDTVGPWIQSETEIVRPLAQSDTGSKQLWTNPGASIFRHWTQSKLNLVMPFTKPDVDTVRLWLQRQTDTIRTWSQPESQKINSWSRSEAERVKFWHDSQMDTFKPWVETELQRANTWSQFEGDVPRAWTKSEANNVKLWFQKQMETVTLLTELITQTAYHWIQSETEIVRPWSQSASDKVRMWTQHEAYTIRPTWDEYDGDNDRLWTPLEAVTIRHSIQSDDSIIIPSVQNEAGTLISYTQTESPEVNSWTQTETETATLLTQGEKTAVKLWLEIVTETITTWAESQFSELNSSKLSVSNIVTLWTQTESPVLNLWPQPVADTFVPGVKDIPSEMNPWSKTIPNTITTWTQPESIAINTWSQSESDTVIPWPQPESVAINPWTQSIADTVTQWIQEESAEIIPWTKIVSDQILPWTQTETPVNHWLQSEMDKLYQTSLSLGPSPTEPLWIETLSGTDTQWSQADSLVVISQTQILTDTVTLYMQAETPSFHSRTMSETDTVTTWTSAESLAVSSLKECETESVSTWVKKGYPNVNFWTQPENDTVTSWAQVETPGINSFTHSVVDMVPPWTQSESSVVNLWTQYVVDVDTLWMQTGSPAVNPWTKSVSDGGVQWTQNEREAVSQWTQTASDKVISFAQAEFPIVESLTNTVTDIVTPWTEVESSAVNPGTEVTADAVTPSNQPIYPSVTPWATRETDILWTHANSDIINLFTETVFHTLILWTQGVILNPWAQLETDIVTPWTQPESPPISSWAWSKTNPVTSWSENKYAVLNPWTQIEANTFAPWSQPEFGAVNSWIHLENDIVTTFIQGESQVLNHSPMVVADAMRAWTQVDSTTVNPGMQADNDKVTLWTKSESLATYHLPISVTDTVTVWNMAAIISVKSWPHSVTETGTQWTQNESPLVYPLTQSIMNSVTLITHTINLAIIPGMNLSATAVKPWTQVESAKENGWTVSETGIPWTMESSPIIKHMMETLSNTNITRIKSEFSEIKIWTSPGARTDPLWTQAESPTVNPWTQSQVHIVTKWTHIDPPTNILTQAKFAAINMWTQSELPTIITFTESRLPAIYPSIQIEGTVTSSMRAEFLAINPWTEITATTVTLWIQAEYPIVNPWTVSENDTAKRGIVAESPSSFLTKSEQHRKPLWTQTESPINPMMQDIANIFTMWTKTESLALNPWTKNIEDTFTVQTLNKSPTENYWTDTLASTLWTHYESPTLNPWTQAVTSTFTQWNQVESPTVNSQEETLVSTFAPWIQFESPRVNSQPGNIVSTMAWLNQDESPITIPCTEAVISRVTLWIQESAVGNSCPQTIASITTLHTEIPWSDIIDATVTTWNKTESLADKVASIVTIWSQDESPAVNPRTYNLVSTDAPWNKVKYVTINYWTLDPSSTVIPWIQTEFPALKIWTQTLFSTILSWTQDEFPANSLTDTVVSIVIPWNHAVSPKIKTWTETLASTLSPWIHTMSPRVDTWAETVSTVTSWTQSLSSAYPLTVIVSSTVTCWTHSEFPGVNSCTDNVIDGIIFWTLLKTESKKEWTLPEASIFTISLHPPVDSTEPLIQIEKPSLLGIYPEISNIQTLPVSEMFISWIVPFTQAAILLPKPEVDVSRYWFKTQTERMKHWTQSEYQTVSTLTQFVAERVDSITQYETDPLTSWIQTKTGISHPWSQFERNTMRTSFFSDSDAVRPLIQTDPGILTPWIHYSNSIVTSWTRVDSNAVSLQTQTEVNTVTQLTQADMSAVKHLTMTVINNAIPWFQNQPDTIRPRTQLESQIITNLVRLEYQFDHSWVQPDAKAIRPLAYFEIHETKPWPQSESQVVSNLTEVDTATFWAPIQNDAIGPWSQTETQMTCSVIPNEVGKISPHIQPETSLITSWTDIQSSKVQPCIPLETAITRPWAQYETVEINPSIQLEADAALRPWLQTQMNSVFSEFDTLISCLQTQGATTRPWIQQSVSPWTQTEVGIILSCTQQRALTDQAWIHPESQEIKSWIKLEADTVKSWLHSQMNKVGPWVYSKSQVVSAPVQPEEGVIHPWIHSEFQADQPWTHSETDFIASAALPKSDSVSVRIKPEIQIRNNTHYEGGIITLFGSWSKSVPFLPKETVSLPDEYFTTMSTEIAATESQPKLQYFHSSEFTNSFLLTLPSLWLPERVDYLNHGSKLQITKTEGSSYMATTSPSLLSPSLSFLTPFSLQSSYTFSPSCSIFSCTFSSSGISQSCSIHSSMAFFSPTLLPLASSVSFVQELNSSKFSEETILSHTVSSLFAAPATLLTKQPSLIHGSQYETNSNHHEQDPLKYSEFNVSLAECHLGVVWKESFQAFWLFKTAIISHETTECGLRPGLIPHCPNCWEAEVGEFPWMVSIQLSFSHFCAGSILNEQWILTTARCANFIKNSEALALVQVGLIDLQDSAQAQTVGIHRAMPYLGPKGPLGPGLLFLKQPLHFQPLVLPICLVESMEQDENIQLYDCWLPSWSLMRGSPGILQKRHLSILQVSTCAQFWPKLNEFTFCVEAKKAMGEAGCKGDLGAPLVCHLQQKDTWVQVGILSHFDEHCTKPYVFSQVSPFLFWLQGVTRPSHAPWSQQGPMTTSASISLSVSASTNASAFTSTPASIRPHFISLPQPQTLADRISLRYAMPWQVMIISCGNQICSGSIVSRSWVLTAAHCVRHMNPEDTAVILGLRHPGTPLRVVKVSTILLHERFRLVSGTARNDLALLLLQEVQTPIQILAPLGNLKNLNTSECWLAGPRILKQGETDENPEVLQMQVMGASSCAHLYPDIGSSIICFVTQAKSSSTNVEPVIPGSAVMCRPTSGNGSWRQIGLTSLKALATIVSPHFSWILSTSAKAGHPLNQAVIPWLEKPKSSGCLTQSTSLLLLSIIVIAVFCDLVVIAK